MKHSIPFTYLIGWSTADAFYYGVRYAEDCHPGELWTTYFTSSKYVREFRQIHGDPDIIIIRKTFTCSSRAKVWEHKVLRRMRVKRSAKFLNRTDNLSPPSTKGLRFSEERRQRHAIQMSGPGNGMFGKQHKQESKQKMSQTKRTRPLTHEMHENYSRAKAGENHPNWGKKQKPHVIEAMMSQVRGVAKTDNHREKLAKAKLGSKHWNNGIVSRLFKGNPPDNTWKPGRLKR